MNYFESDINLNAIVLGGSRGIGKAIAIQLAKDHNYHILINYSAKVIYNMQKEILYTTNIKKHA